MILFKQGGYSMEPALVALATVVVVFFLVVLLGLQIQVTGLTRRLDDILAKLDKIP